MSTGVRSRLTDDDFDAVLVDEHVVMFAQVCVFLARVGAVLHVLFRGMPFCMVHFMPLTMEMPIFANWLVCMPVHMLVRVTGSVCQFLVCMRCPMIVFMLNDLFVACPVTDRHHAMLVHPFCQSRDFVLRL